MSDRINFLADLPPEIQDMISSYFNIVDLYNLISADSTLVPMLRANNFKSIDFSGNFEINYKLASGIYTYLPLEHITHINLNGVHWMTPGEIKRLLKRLPNLQSAYLLGTKMYTNITDVQVLNELPNLDRVAINYASSTAGQFTYYCINHFNQQFGPSRGQAEDKNLTLTKMIEVVQEPYPDDTMFVIHNSNWMNEILERVWTGEGSKVVDYSKNRVEIDLNKCQDTNILERISKERPNIKELIIRSRKNDIIKTSNAKFNLISSFKFLKRLRLEINAGLNNFLSDVFRECKQLRFLRLVSHIPQFRLSHFLNTRSLEHLSLELNGTFQFENFILDLNVNESLKLKRIFLKFWHFPRCSKSLLRNFLEQNPQLIVFVVVCEMTELVAKEINKILQPFSLSPHKQFKFLNARNMDPDMLLHLRPIHYDLLETACYLS